MMIYQGEVVKPDAALALRVAAIERFPDCDIVAAPPEGERVMLLDRPMIAIYSQDSYSETGWTWDETIAYAVYAGSRADPEPAKEVAQLVAAWLRRAPFLDGSPVAAVTSTAGPNLVPDEHETAVLYGTAEMIVAGVSAPARTGEAGESEGA